MSLLSATLRRAQLADGSIVDLRLQQGVLTACASALPDSADEQIDADGRAVGVALKDHHLHLYAAAVARSSLACGPDQVQTSGQLQAHIRQASPGADGWIRGVGYHDGHAGPLNRSLLDACCPDVPVRIQHASGRLWILNSAAIEKLGDVPWQSDADRQQGHLVDRDAWLGQCLRRQQSAPPSLAAVSQELASHGVVALTDTSPANDLHSYAGLQQAQQSGELRQRLYMMGQPSLHQACTDQTDSERLRIGAWKVHLLESALPDFEALCEGIGQAHAQSRPVAFHCVSRTELVFALAALEQAGSLRGDRIEHAGVCPDDCLLQIKKLGLWVVTQPVFIHDRGDRYLREVAEQDQPWLYRLRSFVDQAVPLAGSSDAPYGQLNPWLGIQAALDRCTQGGVCVGADEALNFEQALGLYQGELTSPGQPARWRLGQPVDLCLYANDWAGIRQRPAATRTLLTLERGRVIWRDAV